MSDLAMPTIGELKQAQIERTERARSAIRAGLFQVTRVGPQQWTVKNGDKLPYAVSLEPSQGISEGETWVCTCMDYRQYGPQTRVQPHSAVDNSRIEVNDKMMGFDSMIRRKSPLNEGFTGNPGNSDLMF